MDCKQIQNMIIPYIRNELNNNDIEDFLEHIQTCKTCREELEIYYIIEHGLNSDYSDKNFDIEKSLSDKIKASNMFVSRLRLTKIFYYALNTLLVIGTTLAILLQIRIWWQGGYF